MAASPPTLTLRLVKEEPLTASEMDTNLTDLKTYALDVETQILNGTSAFTDNVISGDIIDGGTISNFSSTGIDDNADGNALTIDSAEKATFSGELAVAGASEFTGEITATAGVAGNSSTATKVYVTDNESTAENNNIAFVADAGAANGNHALEMDGNLTYNPSTSKLSVPNIAATSIVGDVAGALTGNCSGSAATVTGGTQASITAAANLTTVGTVAAGTWGTGAVIGTPTMTLGSDVDGDIYYRSSNILTRLAKGTADQILGMNTGATAPEWKDPESGLSVAVLTGTIAHGGTIPLPSGYIQSECKWTVGVGSFTSTSVISAHSSYCTVNASRVVSMLFHGVSTSNIANYIIIGIK